MNRFLLWMTTAVLGAVATLMQSFGLVAMILFLVLAVPLITRGDHLVALSGLFTGFGGLWPVLIGRQLASGGTSGDDAFWVGVGVVPLVLGAALGLVGAARRRRGIALHGT